MTSVLPSMFPTVSATPGLPGQFARLPAGHLQGLPLAPSQLRAEAVSLDRLAATVSGGGLFAGSLPASDTCLPTGGLHGQHGQVEDEPGLEAEAAAHEDQEEGQLRDVHGQQGVEGPQEAGLRPVAGPGLGAVTVDWHRLAEP